MGVWMRRRLSVETAVVSAVNCVPHPTVLARPGVLSLKQGELWEN